MFRLFVFISLLGSVEDQGKFLCQSVFGTGSIQAILGRSYFVKFGGISDIGSLSGIRRFFWGYIANMQVDLEIIF
jgi:hypothetical protein